MASTVPVGFEAERYSQQGRKSQVFSEEMAELKSTVVRKRAALTEMVSPETVLSQEGELASAYSSTLSGSQHQCCSDHRGRRPGY